MSLFKSVKIINSGKAILLSRKYGAPLRYHSTWLRDKRIAFPEFITLTDLNKLILLDNK